MEESVRILLYPLGFLAGIAFGLRFIIQWLQSERAGKSIVSLTFWRLSFVGSFLLMIHSLIQMQYHVCLIQAFNLVIVWRNLNLMQQKHAPASFHTVLYLFLGAFLTISSLFALQEAFVNGENSWFRIPIAPWQSSESQTFPLSIWWHIVGTIGYLLFSTRFWLQWWASEQSYVSVLPPLFWQFSLGGALLSIIYFFKINDTVNLIGPLLGLVPYTRNLVLIQRAKNKARQTL